MVVPFSTTLSNRHKPIFSDADLKFGCENCSSRLHQLPSVSYEGQTDGPACAWVGLAEVQQSARLKQFDEAYPTRRHWHHRVHLEFGRPCDELCNPKRQYTGESLIDRLKAAYRIEDVAGRLTVLHGSGDLLTGKCPIHNEQNGRAFAVRIDAQKWRCYGKCGTGGDVIDLIRELKSRGIQWIPS